MGKKKAHTHAKKPPRNIFIYTFIHLFASEVFVFYLYLDDAYTRPTDYPRYYFEFHLGLFTLMWFLCMSNLTLARFRSCGKGSAVLESSENCDKCNTTRLSRTHHCSTCEKCVIRMDHHCTWVSNCIGLNNHKNFYWYTFYTAIGGTYYLYLAFQYLFFSNSPSPIRLYSYLSIYHILVVSIFSYFTWALLNMQTRFILKNLTNLEYMKEMGNNMDFMKFVVYSVESTWDCGLLPNLFQVFGKDFMFWPLPTAPDNSKFYRGPSKIPAPTTAELIEYKVKYDLD